jgi:hypothetical protein
MIQVRTFTITVMNPVGLTALAVKEFAAVIQNIRPAFSLSSLFFQRVSQGPENKRS